MQLLSLKNKFKNLDLAKKGKDIFFILSVLSYSVVAIFLAYIIASILNTVLINFIAPTPSKRHFNSGGEGEHANIQRLTNHRDLRKAVLARNIFNSEGELPDEPDPSEGVGNAFDPEGNCSKPTVNVELLGIIFTGNPETSLATIQEKGYTIADVYRAGEKIINQEQALVYAIDEDKVVLNNNGVKECLELNTVKVLASSTASSGSSASKPSSPSASAGEGDGPAEQCPTGTASLESSYVEESLGPGFSKILDAGRLVPFNKDNAMVGFKLIGVRGGSLWSRANLGSGDVITAVNGESLAQPEKGFALYEALQSAKAIRVEFLKAGKTPCITNVEIK